MKRFWFAVGGGALGLVIFDVILLVLGVLGWEPVALAAMAFAILIGACTGLIYGKLDEMENHICAIFSEQEKTKCMAERTDRNTRQVQRNQVAGAENCAEVPGEEEPPKDGE